MHGHGRARRRARAHAHAHPLTRAARGAASPHAHQVFDEFDADKGGTIVYSELNEALRKMKLPPKRALNRNKRPPKSKQAALAEKLKFKPDKSKSAGQQLKELLASALLQVKELLMYWDENGDGLIDAKEFRKAIAALGIGAPRKEVHHARAAHTVL